MSQSNRCLALRSHFVKWKPGLKLIQQVIFRVKYSDISSEIFRVEKILSKINSPYCFLFASLLFIISVDKIF